ncbi:MAG: hypothetical protein ABI557_02750 [Aureliella sp.]
MSSQFLQLELATHRMDGNKRLGSVVSRLAVGVYCSCVSLLRDSFLTVGSQLSMAGDTRGQSKPVDKTGHFHDGQ